MRAIVKPSGMFVAAGRRLGCLALVSILWLGSTDTAFAAKKKPEPEAAPTKSYTVPYLIVIAMIGIGIMAVGRPSNRLDKVGDKVQEKKDE